MTLYVALFNLPIISINVSMYPFCCEHLAKCLAQGYVLVKVLGLRLQLYDPVALYCLSCVRSACGYM